MKERNAKTILTPENEKNLKKLLKALKENPHQIYQAGTGTGKTLVAFCTGIKYALNSKKYFTRVFVIVPNSTARDQWIATIEGLEPRLDKGKTNEGLPFVSFEIEKEKNPDNCRLSFVFATYSWVSRHGDDDKFLRDFNMYVCDECHRSGAPVWSIVINHLLTEKAFAKKPIIGITADPARHTSGKDVKKVFEMWKNNVVVGPDVKTAIEQRIFKAPIYVAAIHGNVKPLIKGVPEENMRVATQPHLYQEHSLDLSRENQDSIGNILTTYVPDMTNRKGYVFVDRVDDIFPTAIMMKSIYPEADCFVNHFRLGERAEKEQVEGFRKAKSGFMISVNRHNESSHIEGANIVIMLRRTVSPTLYFQQFGRALAAKSSAYPAPIIFDIVGNYARLEYKSGSEKVYDHQRTRQELIKSWTEAIAEKRYTQKILEFPEELDIMDVFDIIEKILSGKEIKWNMNMVNGSANLIYNKLKSSKTNFADTTANINKLEAAYRFGGLTGIKKAFSDVDLKELKEALIRLGITTKEEIARRESVDNLIRGMKKKRFPIRYIMNHVPRYITEDYIKNIA